MAALNVPVHVVNAVALDADGRTATVGASAWGAVTWELTRISADPLRGACADPGVRGGVSREPWDSPAVGGGLGDHDDFHLCP
ncbi:hypothetical protein AB0J28_22255 [Streptosporangium canum]|uniref:hypothetical protein n=1 Tax=Streptosporangium canum TaxID=324952 RepID=UPI003448C037